MFAAAALGPSAGIAVAGTGYNYNCDGTHHDTIYDLTQDVSLQSYWINEVLSYVSAEHIYPCRSTSTTWGAGYDFPFILGANLQYTSTGTDHRLVQLGFGRCENNGNIQCGGSWQSGLDMLAWTPADNSGGFIAPATWWNQGLGSGVVKDGDLYEMAILPVSGSRWEFAVRDVTANSTWAYGYETNNWPVQTGGNVGWWGTETNNYASAMGVPVVNTSFAMNTMEWRESDNGSWHRMTAPDCLVDGSPPWYYGCGMYSSNTLESWTDAH